MRKLFIVLILLVAVPIGLLTASIVAGAAFATFDGQCTQSTSGFTGGDVLVGNFGLNSEGQIVMEVRNGVTSSVQINSVTLDGETSQISETSIGVGQSETIEFGEFEMSDDCNDMDLEIEYNVNGEDKSSTGTLTHTIE